jgi:Ca-activated chloride channel family protein
MDIELKAILSNNQIDSSQTVSQRQLSVYLSAKREYPEESLPLNLCLVLDKSGSMRGLSMDAVKQAALSLVKKLSPQDRLAIVTFNHWAEVLLPNQFATDVKSITEQIQAIEADGGTAIDEGLKLGIKEIAGQRDKRVSHIFLLTDGENEHGDNQKCLKLAQLALEYNITLHTLGFGDHWNQDILEKIADSAGGSLSYIEKPAEAMEKFSRLFDRMQSVGLTNAHLLLDFVPEVRLAELKPVAQVAPETVELSVQEEDEYLSVRLGDLMTDTERVVLVNFYLSKLPVGTQTIGNVLVRYDDPGLPETEILSDSVQVQVQVATKYQPQTNDKVDKHILTLAKYRQTRIAETKLKEGDKVGAATMLQIAAQTALQLGDEGAATVLQSSATCLQSGEGLSDEEQKKTRIVSKIIV